ncbi:MAG: aldo/keto reductase [Chloroflexota bacterium]
MEYRTLGRTGLKVSLLSYGTGGPSRFGQRAGMSAQERNRLIRRCLDLGINLFDSSEQYGDSEDMLGAALEGVPRDSYILATKWGHSRNQHKEMKEDPEELARSVEGSLSRLRTDYIDVMQFHGLTAWQHDEVVERFYPVMRRLREQGKVRFIGFSEMMTIEPRHDGATEALRKAPELWDTVMLKYGILNQWAAKEALPLAQEHNVGILNMAPVRLTLTRPEEMRAVLDEWRDDPDIPVELLPQDDPLGWLARDGADSVISAGYKFATSHPAISTVITGTSSIEHLEANVAAINGSPLPEDVHAKLVEVFGNTASTH